MELQNENLTVLKVLVIGMLCGLIVGAGLMHERWQSKCVKAGVAEWVAKDNGSPKWDWVAKDKAPELPYVWQGCASVDIHIAQKEYTVRFKEYTIEAERNAMIQAMLKAVKEEK